VRKFYTTKLVLTFVRNFGGLEVSVLAFGTRVRGFKPDRIRRIFSGEKILSTPSFGREVKPSVLCRKFTACKRTQKWLSAKFSAITRPYFHLPLLGFARVVLDVGDTWWRELERSNTCNSKLEGLTCRWQRHCVKTSCWEYSTIVELAKTHKIEEEEDLYETNKEIKSKTSSVLNESAKVSYVYVSLFQQRN